ncbi:MAG: putative bifunctional diguanylate cyclase/phosphodiesterase [Vulcanimicrobiaceae bacterium]
MNKALRSAAVCVVVLSVLLSAGVVLTAAAQRTLPLVWALPVATVLVLLAFGVLVRRQALFGPAPEAETPPVSDDPLADPLTGLPNAQAFAQLTDLALQRCALVENASLSVYSLDLDDFKSVNERYGQRAGNRLLVAAAERLGSVLRGKDIVARTGGDKFTVLVCHPKDDGIAGEVGERMVRAFDEPLLVEGTVHLIGASAGVASLDPEHKTVEALLRDAHLALAQAKDQGRSRLVKFDAELEKGARERSQLAADLREAMDREDGPHVLFQPIVDLDDGRCCGFEAILHWEHPAQGEIRSELLFEVAREAQLLAPLGRRVVRDVCRRLAGWRDDGVQLDQLSIHINVSPAEAAYFESCDAFENALRSYAIPARTLVIELTEDALARDQMSGIFVARLESMGVRVCLNDFGTGYSSLRRLDEFRVDTLKIDRSFVVSAAEDSGKQSLVAGIVGLAEGLHVEVIAEGIETEEERDLVEHLGCRYAQGRFFGRPLPPSEARDLAYRATRRA